MACAHYIMHGYWNEAAALAGSPTQLNPHSWVLSPYPAGWECDFLNTIQITCTCYTMEDKSHSYPTQTVTSNMSLDFTSSQTSKYRVRCLLYYVCIPLISPNMQLRREWNLSESAKLPLLLKLQETVYLMHGDGGWLRPRLTEGKETLLISVHQ